MHRNDPALQRLVDHVQSARAAGAQLSIRGGGTKDFYGQTPQGDPLDTTVLEGISSYEPTELVVTARCGTSLAELEAALAERGQCLPFEPPHYAAGGTVGGMVAAGLAGPARAAVGWLGATGRPQDIDHADLPGHDDYFGAYLSVGLELDVGRRFTTGPEVGVFGGFGASEGDWATVPQIRWHFLYNF